MLAFWDEAAEEFDRPNDTPEAVQALIECDPGALMLAVDGRQIAGSVIAAWDGWRGHIYRLAVHPSQRRAGLAAWLLEAAEERLRKRGCVRVDAIVLDENKPAQQLWVKAGYERQALWSRWVKQLLR